MARDSRKQEVGEARSEFDGDTIEQVMRERVGVVWARIGAERDRGR